MAQILESDFGHMMHFQFWYVSPGSAKQGLR